VEIKMTEKLTPIVDSRPSKGRWILVLLIVMIFLGASCTWRVHDYAVRHNLVFQPPEMAEAQFAKEDAIGDLGGVQVRIPQAYAGYLEYEGDPGFGPRPKGPRPVRTQASKIISFGFDAKLPDLTALSALDSILEATTQEPGKRQRMLVGISSGDRYQGDNFLTVLFEDRVTTPTWYSKTRFLKSTTDHFGLKAFVVKGFDSDTQKPWRETHHATDLFIYKDSTGNVTAFIECLNTPWPGASCDHKFAMHPRLKAHINLQYERRLLPQWKEIEEAAREKIESFVVKPNT
jgi:hypothetical protein